MTYARGDFDSVTPMPSWITGARAETPEDVAFLSGAALSHLHLALGRREVPLALLRARLALRAAEASVAFSGRPERARELRDAAAFLQPGDSPGPAGAVWLSWRRAVDRPISVKALHRALRGVDADQIGVWLDAGQGAPVPCAADVLQAVIEDRPRDHAAALLLAEASLAQSLGWSHVRPLLALGLERGDLRKAGEALRLACHRAIGTASAEAAREAADLARRAARMKSVAPKLRARGRRRRWRCFWHAMRSRPSR